MPSQYLASVEYAAYGVPTSTTIAQVVSASVTLDAYLKRPEGLAWSPDSSGNPAWMSALTPAATVKCAAGIQPGLNVQVALSGPISMVSVGEVLIIDRGSSELAEAVVVVGTLAPNLFTLASVSNAHGVNCNLDLGLTIKQHKFCPNNRPLVNLAYTPVARLISGQGRYGYGRRIDSSRYQVDDFNLLASLQNFGGPPAWEFFPVTNTGIDPQTGQVWVPAGVMLAYYSEVNIWYVAGYQASNIPDQIKFAVAELINNKNFLGNVGNVKSYQAGDTKIQQFASSALTDDTKAMLAGFRAKLYG